MAKNLADELLESVKEATEFAKGRHTKGRVHRFGPDDVRLARATLGMTQAEFSEVLGVPLPTLRHWEQGNRLPSGAAMALIRVIVREPRAVKRALRRDGEYARRLAGHSI